MRVDKNNINSQMNKKLYRYLPTLVTYEARVDNKFYFIAVDSFHCWLQNSMYYDFKHWKFTVYICKPLIMVLLYWIVK